MFAKGNKSRIEPKTAGGPGIVMLYDGDAHTRVSLMPEQRMYMEVPAEMSANALKEAAAKEEYTFTKTGKTETVAGHPCEIVLAKKKNGETETETCVAKGLGNYLAMMGMSGMDMSRGGHRSPAWMRELAQEGLYPLRTISRSREGAEQVRVEVTKLEPKRLEPALFTVPAGYTKMDMGGMPGMGRPGMPGKVPKGMEKFMPKAPGGE